MLRRLYAGHIYNCHLRYGDRERMHVLARRGGQVRSPLDTEHLRIGVYGGAIVSDADIVRSYRAYAKSLPRRVHRALSMWRKQDGPFWRTMTIKGKPYRYHVITARDAKAFDDGE
jgi:hypothetical protein